MNRFEDHEHREPLLVEEEAQGLLLLEWLARDVRGHVALFTALAPGDVSPEVLDQLDEHRRALAAILGGAPPTTRSVFGPPVGNERGSGGAPSWSGGSSSSRRIDRVDRTGSPRRPAAPAPARPAAGRARAGGRPATGRAPLQARRLADAGEREHSLALRLWSTTVLTRGNAWTRTLP